MKLLTDMTHLLAIQSIVQPRQGDREAPMQIVKPGRPPSRAGFNILLRGAEIGGEGLSFP